MNPEVASRIAVCFGADALLRSCNRHPRVVFWHGVAPNPDPRIESEIVDLDSFKKQIRYLQKHYRIVSVQEFYERFKEHKWEGKEVCLQFDDGFKNNLTVAAPFLKEQNIPFVVFVSTNHIETGKFYPTSLARVMIWGSGLEQLSIPSIGFQASIRNEQEKAAAGKHISEKLKTSPLPVVQGIYDDLKNNVSSERFSELVDSLPDLHPMTWENVCEIQNYGCTIGAHCLEHICCHDKQDESVVREQIVSSKRIIETKIGKPCEFFAYPNGSFTDFSNKVVMEEAGFKMSFSTKPTRTELCSNMAIVPRICLPSNYNLARIKLNYYPR